MASEDPVYKVHSTVRDIRTRTARVRSPTRHRFVLRLAGGAITVRRARPATVTLEVLRRYLDVLKDAQREGKIEVRTVTGQPVDLDTFKPIGSLPVAPPKPHRLLDSAANDKTFPGGVGDPNFHHRHGQDTAITDKVDPPNSGRLPGDEEDTPIQMTRGMDPAALRKEQREAAEQETSEPPVPEAPPTAPEAPAVEETLPAAEMPPTDSVAETTPALPDSEDNRETLVLETNTTPESEVSVETKDTPPDEEDTKKTRRPKKGSKSKKKGTKS